MQNVQTPKINIGTLLRDGLTLWRVHSINTHSVTLASRGITDAWEMEASFNYVENLEIVENV